MTVFAEFRLPAVTCEEAEVPQRRHDLSVSDLRAVEVEEICDCLHPLERDLLGQCVVFHADS